MKSPNKFKWSAFVALCAIGAMGAVGACGKDGGPGPDPDPIPAPTGLTATVISETQIDLAWNDNATVESGYRVESCSGAGCANFAEIATVAADVTSYQAMGLTASTAYSFRVRAHNAEGASDFSNTVSASTAIIPPPPPPPTAILVGAGEITSCASSASLATATLVEGMLADANVSVFTVGNNLADTLTAGASFQSCFEPSWGRAAIKSRTRYAVGQMDFESVGEEATYAYFGDRLPSPDGWYSYDLGSWHIIVLNSSTWQHGSDMLQDPVSRQNQWLAADLAANTKPCIMAISWERRLYTTETGGLGRNFNMNEPIKLLYAAGADVLVSAKDKIYARFPLSNPDGVLDAERGFRQFIVGTGGRSFDQIKTPAGSTVEVQQGGASGTWGVIKFKLDANSYTWEFVPTIVGGFTDTGTQNCH